MFCQIILEALRKIDIFGLKTEFRIQKNPKFYTISGGLFSLFYMGIIISLFILFGGDMLDRKNPESSFSQFYRSSPLATEISKDQYFFIFGLQDSTSSHFIDEEIYNVNMFYGHKDHETLEMQRKELKVEPCTEEHLPTNRKLFEYFMRQGNKITDLYCVTLNHSKMVLEGAWDDETRYSYIDFDIKPCNASERK